MKRMMWLLLSMFIYQGMALATATRPVTPLGTRAISPGVRTAPPAIRARLVVGNTDFALRLYKQLRAEKGNLVVSPYSISTALAMTYAGAEGETKRQMAETLRFYLPDDQLHFAFADIQCALAAQASAQSSRDGTPFQLHVANALWSQQGHPFLRSYVQTLQMYYASEVQFADFRANPEQARAAINQWVSKQTASKIPNLFPPGVLNQETRLVLANAVYFNAAWVHRFPKQDTAPGPFTLLSGESITTDMMHQTLTTRYGKGTGYQAVELGYQGANISMILIVPDAGQFPRYETALTVPQLTRAIANVRETRVNLTMPKFRYTSQFSLANTLKAMGMREAFEPQRANFSRMDGSRDLFIQAVIHQALIRVDEDGTEAAAATGVAVGITSAPAGEIVTLTLDRPFLYAIRDNQTGTLLFLGRVVDPRGA